MKDKQQKNEKIKFCNSPVTKLELQQELGLIKKEMTDLKQEIKQEIKQEFSKFTIEVCKQIEAINGNFEDRFKENKKEHFEIRRDISRIKNEIGI